MGEKEKKPEGGECPSKELGLPFPYAYSPDMEQVGTPHPTLADGVACQGAEL